MKVLHRPWLNTLNTLIMGACAVTALACNDDQVGDAGMNWPADGTETAGDGDGDPGDGDGDPGGGDPGGGGSGDGGGSGSGDGDGEADGCVGVCGTPECGICPEGPDSVDIGQFTVDATEITNAQYAPFVAVEFSQAHLDGWLPPACAFKADFTPEDWAGNLNPELPVIGVDWCDAVAYCSWAGKRLCGRVGGGPAEIGDVQDPMDNEWYRACTQDGLKNYPYGLVYDGSACNTMGGGLGKPAEVGSFAACEGGHPGLFDLSGNVWEWTNACDETEECRRRGGSFISDGPIARCAVDSRRGRDYRSTNQGIRCCGEP